MDFIGNYGNSVKIPTIYFNINTFDEFVEKIKLKEIKRIDDIKYYKWYWIYINSKKLHFVSILK